VLRAAEDYMAHQHELVRRQQGGRPTLPECVQAVQSFEAAGAAKESAQARERAFGRALRGRVDGGMGSAHTRKGPGEHLEVLAIAAAAAEAS
jgi:hypothetical protein